MLDLPVAKNEVVVRILVEPPAVDAVPGRMRIARPRCTRACFALLFGELGECGGGEQIAPCHLFFRKQFRAAALDQTSVELGTIERPRRCDPPQEGAVGLYTGDLDRPQR